MEKKALTLAELIQLIALHGSMYLRSCNNSRNNSRNLSYRYTLMYVKHHVDNIICGSTAHHRNELKYSNGHRQIL